MESIEWNTVIKKINEYKETETWEQEKDGLKLLLKTYTLTMLQKLTIYERLERVEDGIQNELKSNNIWLTNRVEGLKMVNRELNCEVDSLRAQSIKVDEIKESMERVTNILNNKMNEVVITLEGGSENE